MRTNGLLVVTATPATSDVAGAVVVIVRDIKLWLQSKINKNETFQIFKRWCFHTHIHTQLYQS